MLFLDDGGQAVSITESRTSIELKTACLRCLHQLSAHLGLVLTPYLHYPR